MTIMVIGHDGGHDGGSHDGGRGGGDNVCGFVLHVFMFYKGILMAKHVKMAK